jgi:hypothetical protein
LTRFVTRALAVAAATVGLVFAQVAPASATVHEIVGQWCSGRDPLGPPGISGGSNANNFAKPLEASGFIGPIEDNFDPDGAGGQPEGSLIRFNYDNPNVKVVGTGDFVNISPAGEPPLYIELIEPNPAFPAFQHCPKLATG